MTEATVSLYFRWIMYRPDQRTYRQNSVELFPCTQQNSDLSMTFPPLLEVKIPLKHDYLANTEDIITKQMSGEIAPAPILTLAGMRYVQDQFDAVLYDTEVPKDDEAQPAAADGDWDETQFLTGKPAATPEKGGWDDDWGEGDHPNAVDGPTDVATGPDAAKDDEWVEATANENADAPWKEDWGK